MMDVAEGTIVRQGVGKRCPLRTFQEHLGGRRPVKVHAQGLTNCKCCDGLWVAAFDHLDYLQITAIDR